MAHWRGKAQFIVIRAHVKDSARAATFLTQVSYGDINMWGVVICMLHITISSAVEGIYTLSTQTTQLRKAILLSMEMSVRIFILLII